jgi:hypothetical protein
MFFLIRCVFWLGLVFSHIAEQQGFDAAALFGQRPAMSSLGGMALEAAGRQCRAEPDKCLALASRASRLAPQVANPNPAGSHDTLSAGDRAPAWRLRPGVGPDAGKRE